MGQAILERQHKAVVRHGDETGWRIQVLRQTGRSGRAWLWISVTMDTAYFHIDASRGTEAALKVFGGAAAGHSDLTDWCRAWIQRIAWIYRLNKTRLSHYQPGAERQPPAFTAVQRELQVELEGLFDTAERELASLDEHAREAAPLEPPPATLDAVRPVRLQIVLRGTPQSRQWNTFVARYHYLGYKTLVGAQMRHTVHDRDGRLLALLGFSTAARKLAPRDRFIGWTPAPPTRPPDGPMSVSPEGVDVKTDRVAGPCVIQTSLPIATHGPIHPALLLSTPPSR